MKLDLTRPENDAKMNTLVFFFLRFEFFLFEF